MTSQLNKILEEFEEKIGRLAGWSLVSDADSHDDAANQGYDAACEKTRKFLQQALETAYKAGYDSAGVGLWPFEDWKKSGDALGYIEDIKSDLKKELLEKMPPLRASEPFTHEGKIFEMAGVQDWNRCLSEIKKLIEKI